MKTNAAGWSASPHALLFIRERTTALPERQSMQFDSMLNYVRMAMAFVVLATLGTAARAQDLPSFMAPIAFPFLRR
jgi:hypothetical protein